MSHQSVFAYKPKESIGRRSFIMYNINAPDYLSVKFKWAEKYQMTFDRMCEVMDSVLVELSDDSRRREKQLSYERMLVYTFIEKVPDYTGNIEIMNYVYNFINGKFSDNKSLPAIKVYTTIERKKLNIEVYCTNGVVKQYDNRNYNKAVVIKGKFFAMQGYGFDSSNFEINMENFQYVNNVDIDKILDKFSNGLQPSYLYRTTTWFNPCGNTPTKFNKFEKWCQEQKLSVNSATMEDYHLFKLTT